MDKIAPMLPLGRLCTPPDVAPIVAFLASDLGSYMAAQMRSVDAVLKAHNTIDLK